MLFFAHLGLALAAASFVKRSNLAFVAIGSLLPDIIDKPLGQIAFGTPAMGRTFAHTLLFLLILAMLAAYTQDIRIASLSGGVLMHLVLDSMWNSPVILFWPLLGSFPIAAHLDTLAYLEMLLFALKDPVVLVPECLGLAYLIYFVFHRRHILISRAKDAMERSNEGMWTSVRILLRGT